MLKVLIATNLYPNDREPGRGIFNKQQFDELAKLCDIKIIAPIPWGLQNVKMFHARSLDLQSSHKATPWHSKGPRAQSKCKGEGDTSPAEGRHQVAVAKGATHGFSARGGSALGGQVKGSILASSLWSMVCGLWSAVCGHAQHSCTAATHGSPHPEVFHPWWLAIPVIGRRYHDNALQIQSPLMKAAADANSRPLRVLLVPGPCRSPITSGVDRYLHALVGSMSAGIEYVFTDCSISDATMVVGSASPAETPGAIKSAVLRLIPGNVRLLLGYMRETWRLSKVLRPYRDQSDLIHVNRVGCEIQSIAAKLAGFKRVITTIHNLPGDAEAHNWVCRLVERASFKCGDIHIAVSEAAFEAWHDRVGLNKVTFEGGKCVVIRNGLSPAALSGFDRKSYRQPFCADPDSTFIIGICARLHRMKGHMVLLKAFAKFLETLEAKQKASSFPLLLIAGDGPEKASIESMMHELNICDHVKLLGHMHEPEKFVSSIDLNVLPSVELETIGYSVIEAMFHGVPSVVSDTGGMKEIISASHGGEVVAANDVMGLCEAIRLYYMDKDLRMFAGEAARTYARRELLASRMAELTMGVYRSAL